MKPAPINLTLNGQPISKADARAALVAIYGAQRTPEILAGLASGLHGCASVAAGYLEPVKTPAETKP